MPLNPRTYVLKVRSDADRNALAGRVENVVTGQQREFASAQELIDSIASDIEASGREPPADATACDRWTSIDDGRIPGSMA